MVAASGFCIPFSLPTAFLRSFMSAFQQLFDPAQILISFVAAL